MICWVVERKEQEDVKEKEQGEKRKEKEDVQRKSVKNVVEEKEQRKKARVKRNIIKRENPRRIKNDNFTLSNCLENIKISIVFFLKKKF